MKRTMTAALVALLLAVPALPSAVAGGRPGRAQGPHCGGEFRDSASCSFRYRGGQLYVNGSVEAAGNPEGAALIRLEARSRVTGTRSVLLACATPGSGACGAGGTVAVEDLREGQRLFCIVEGHGRGRYECGALIGR